MQEYNPVQAKSCICQQEHEKFRRENLSTQYSGSALGLFPPRFLEHLIPIDVAYATVNFRVIFEKLALKLVRDFKGVDIKAFQVEFASSPWFIFDTFLKNDNSDWVWDAH